MLESKLRFFSLETNLHTILTTPEKSICYWDILSNEGAEAVYFLYQPLSFIKAWNYNTRNTISFSVSRIYFIYLMTHIDSTNDQNTTHRVI